jgi:arabinofuranosyltransferase
VPRLANGAARARRVRARFDGTAWQERAVVWTLALSAAAVQFLHASSYETYFPDDAFISLRYAERFATGLGLTWTDGERVEGYTNFLWVVLTAALGRFLDSFELAPRVLGHVTATLTLWALFFRTGTGVRGAGIPAFFGAVMLSGANAFAAYTGSGLEQPLLAALLAWAAVLSYPVVEESRSDLRAVLPAGIVLSLLPLTRPDALLFVAATLAVVVLRRPLRASAYRAAFRLALVPAAVVALHLVFRRAYYGDWVPNTYHAKVAFSAARAREGWLYLKGCAEPVEPLLALAVLATVLLAFDARRRFRALLLAALGLSWCGAVIAIGGDIFPTHRFFVPVLVVCALLVKELFELAFSLRVALGLPLLALGPPVAAATFHTAFRAPHRGHAVNDAWHRPGQSVGRFLRLAFEKERPLLAVDPAGILPYFYKLPALDMLGLTDAYLAKHPPADFGKGYIGHELGDGRYVLERKPDLIALWTPLGGEIGPFRSGRELLADPSFRKSYQPVTFETLSLPDIHRPRLFVRREDGRIGVRRSGTVIEVPGFLFSQGPGGLAKFDAEARLGAVATRENPARLEKLRVERGSYRFEISASVEVAASVSVSPPCRRRSPPAPSTLEVCETEAMVSFSVSPTRDPLGHVLGAKLTRLQP